MIVNKEYKNFANELAAIETDFRNDQFGNMGNIDAGQKILDDPQALDSFLSERRNHIANYERFSDEMKKNMESRELELMKQHPAAIGKLSESMSMFEDKGIKKSQNKTGL